jgi:hypothetical protein
VLWIVAAALAIALVVLAVQQTRASGDARLTWLLVGTALLLLLLGTLRLGPRLLALLGPLTVWLLWALRRQRERTPGPDASGTRSAGVMSRQEALRVLGLSQGASPEQVRAAHRQLIKKLHPDHGGSSFLAQQVNDAKQVLLER